MLLALVVTALLWTVGVLVVVRASVAVLMRLDIQWMGLLLALGIAERPVEQKRKQRRRLGELLVEPRTQQRA